MELCRALRASRVLSTRLRLRIGKLDMSCLGVPRTVVLLEQLEPEVSKVKKSRALNETPSQSYGLSVMPIFRGMAFQICGAALLKVR